VDALELERDERAAQIEVQRAVHAQPGNLQQPLERVARDVAAVLAHVLHPPAATRHWRAAPTPIASATGIVPASNFAGGSAQVDSVSPTRAIMCPPPRNGGTGSSSSPA